MEWHESECVNRNISALVLDLSLFDLDGFQVVQSLVRPKVIDFLDRALDIESEEMQLDHVEVQVDSVVA